MSGRPVAAPAGTDGLVVRRLLDLSHPLRTGMPVYPGDPDVRVEQASTVAAGSTNVLRLHLGSQSGTHVDAPFHVRDDLPRLDEVPLDRFAGPCVVVDVRGLGRRAAIGPEVLDGVRDRLGPGVVVLLATGWDAHWDSAVDATDDAYLAHPWPTPAFARALLATGVRCLGVDALSVDLTPPLGEGGDQGGGEEGGLDTHLVLAEAGCVIAENLRGLGALLDALADGPADVPADLHVSLYPLHLPGADGAPVRAVATLTRKAPTP